MPDRSEFQTVKNSVNTRNGLQVSVCTAYT